MAGLQGKIFSGYQLAEQVNGGGIADVYRAHPTNPGGREAIVKIVHPEFAQQKGFLPHFREIVKLSKRLANHPHILPLLASGEEGGYLYLVTPFVASGTLKDWIARGERLGASDAGPFFRQLCDALGYAHSLGIVHSNIKPSNIFLFEGRHVLLGDFGMLWDIRMLREFAQMDVAHSAEAVEYLAPEVASNRATQQSDIYSVGAVLFAAITGQAPFQGTTLGEVLSAHERKPVPHLQQINPRLIPAMQALDSVTQCALAKRPEGRFPSAIALSQAIEATLSQVPAMVYTPPIAAVPQIPQPQMPPMTPLAGQLMSQAGQLMSQAGQWLHPGPAGGGAPGAVGGPGLQALNPPFPPLQSSEMVDETMEHGRVNMNPSPIEAPTGRVRAPQVPLIGGPSDQTTLHVPAPEPSRSLPRPPAMSQGPVGMEKNVADWSDTSGGGNAGMLPAISPSSLGSAAGNRRNGTSPAGPGSPPGYQAGYQPHYSGWENSGGLYSEWVSGGLPPPGIESSGDYIDSGKEDGWIPDRADEDASAWDKLTSQRYAVVNPGDPYRDDNGPSYDSYGPMRNQIGHTSEYTDERHAYGDSRSYGAADSWGERYAEGYTGEYTGSGYVAESESRALDIWPREKLGHTSGSEARGFSPTQLGLPRLTNPSLDSGLPQAWQDIVSGALPPPAQRNSWNGATSSNGASNIANWGDGTGFSESLSAYSAQMPQPQAADWFEMEPGHGVQMPQPQAADWFEMDSRRGNRWNPAAPLIPFEEQRVWTIGTTALGRRSRWTSWLIAILLIVAVINLGLLVVMRPDLCPSSTAHSCQTISAKAHKLLPFLAGQSAPPVAQLTSSPPRIILPLAANKKTATTTLTLTNSGPTTAHWTASSASTWLTLDKTSGVLASKGSVTLTLAAGSAGLRAGPNTTAITITSGSQVLIVPVTVTVTAS